MHHTMFAFFQEKKDNGPAHVFSIDETRANTMVCTRLKAKKNLAPNYLHWQLYRNLKQPKNYCKSYNS